MHTNSLIAYEKEYGRLGTVESNIYEFLLTTGGGKTDKQIAELMGFDHLSKVQPRITTLIGKGLLMESLSVKCEATGRTVRTSRIRGDSPQEEMF